MTDHVKWIGSPESVDRVGDMSLEELVRTQKDGTIPGDAYYVKKVKPMAEIWGDNQRQYREWYASLS